jgi:hypothetical protein
VTGPAWLAALLATVMLLIAAVSGARLALWRMRGRPAEPEADALHVLMGVAMAGMFEPRISPVPGTVWLALFAAAAAWFAVRAVRARGQHGSGGRRPGSGNWQCAHPAPHAVESAAMVYMLAPGRGAGHGSAMAMPGMAGATANPAVALILAMFMLGYILWMADRMTRQSRVLAPRTASCCKIAMSLAMGYMLLTMQ